MANVLSKHSSVFSDPRYPAPQAPDVCRLLARKLNNVHLVLLSFLARENLF